MNRFYAMNGFLVLSLSLCSLPALAQEKVTSVSTQPVAFATPIQNSDDLPIDISAENLRFEQQKGRALFTGDVKVVHGDIRLASDLLEVFYIQKAVKSATQNQANQAAASSEGRLDKIIATGHVTLVAGEDTATGDKIEYNLASQMVEMTGNVLLVRGESILKGDSLTYNLSTKSLKVNGEESDGDEQRGRVKATFSLKDGQKSVQEMAVSESVSTTSADVSASDDQ